MSLSSSPAHSTRLENLSFDPEGVKFDLDGRSVRLARETAGPAFAALQAFYQSALADYQARPPPSAKPGWFTRLRTWLGRLIGGPGPELPERPQFGAQPPLVTPPSASEATASHCEPDAAGLADAGSRGQRGRPQRPAASPSAPQAVASPAAPQAVTPPPPVAPSIKRAAGESQVPALRAVFADAGGVRLVWQSPHARSPEENIERIHPLDSQLARSLGDCYDHLGRLGYKIVGLDLLKAANPEPANEAPSEPAIKTPASPGAKSPKPAPEPPKPAEKKESSIVARLLPELADEPNRALVRSIDETDATQVLVAPEKTLQVLRAAAEPDRLAAERLTYLRCAAAKAGVKVVAVGLGEGKDKEPARWEELAPWLARQQPQAGPALKKPPAAEPPAPRPAAEPELNL